MGTLNVIHTADRQLGKPIGRFPPDAAAAVSEARFDAIDRIAAFAANQGLAHVLVAGDVFDNVDPGYRVVMQALSRLHPADVTWWPMPGNHVVRQCAPDEVVEPMAAFARKQAPVSPSSALAPPVSAPARRARHWPQE